MKKNRLASSPMDAALDYLSDRARTVREVEEKLDSLNYGEYKVNQVISRLIELKYLDDEKYAADFIATRLATKPISRKKLWTQLYAHKLSKDVINAALEAVTPETEQENALAWRKSLTLSLPRLKNTSVSSALRADLWAAALDTTRQSARWKRYTIMPMMWISPARMMMTANKKWNS